MADFPGTPGNDTLTGTPDADSVSGLGGNDYLVGGDGADTLRGGPATIRSRCCPPNGDGEVYDGGRGIDTLLLSESGAAACDVPGGTVKRTSPLPARSRVQRCPSRVVEFSP
jgi:hypothetical protein